MINPNDFKNGWNAEIYPLIKYDKERIVKLEIQTESKKFLFEAGLPESAAPFLSFESIDRGALLSLIVKCIKWSMHCENRYKSKLKIILLVLDSVIFQ